MNEFYEEVEFVINQYGPLKTTELPVKLIEEFGEDIFPEWVLTVDEELTDLLETLVERRRIIKIEYFLPGLERCKSIFFPRLTEVRIRGLDH